MLHILHEIIRWLTIHTGSANEPGVALNYNFWSGFGSDLGEIALLGAIFATWKHHNCAVPRCPRLAHHKYLIPETKQTTCRKHHTQYWHDLLVEQYKEDYPEQHALINKEKYVK